jgi:pimeloyl-ACP methyl ester carboxylesterase
MLARQKLCVVLLVLLQVATRLAQGADYVREKKWADEITPGIVVGDPVYLRARSGHKFLAISTEVPNARAGLVIVHGMGIHPDWGLIGVLRSELADQGYSTLSVQMPVLAREAKPEEYVQTFDEASERLRLGVDFLRKKGHSKIAVVSHSMGSRMSHRYLTRHPDAQVKAWVSIGMGGSDDYRDIKLPVLDLYGENDSPGVLENAVQRAASIKHRKGSQQIRVPKADHFFNNHHSDLVKYVKGFLDKSM